MIVWALLAGLAAAQTQVDLRTQGKSVDFSEATSTRPFKMGTALPLSCAIGETFFKTSAPSGQNLYTCTAANVWTLQGAGTVTNTQGALAEGLPVIGNGANDVKVAGKTGSGTEFVVSQSPTLAS